MVGVLTKKESMIIDYLKGIAIILVVVDHAFSYYGRSNDLSTTISLLITVVQYVHIPIFFVIAGFLCKKQSFSVFYRKKLKRILIPFWFFSVLKLFYSMFISNEFAHAASLADQLYDAFILGETYWFAYAISLVYLVAPLFWFDDSRKTPPKRVIVTLVVFAVLNISYYGFHWHFLKIVFQFRNAVFYLPFFLCGILIRYYYAEIKEFVTRKNVLLGVLSGIVITAVVVLEYLQINTNLFVTKFLAAFSLSYFIIQSCRLLPENLRILKYTGECSWQIMLLDAFYKAVGFAILTKICQPSPIVAVVVAFIVLLSGLITCKIMEKIPFLNILIGLK